VNALLALGFEQHVHHARVSDWLFMRKLEEGVEHATLASCAITELGFIRIAAGKSRLSENLPDARATLRRLKGAERFVFLNDHLDAETLPRWVSKSEQTTDGHLLVLAKAHGACLATLDEGIPEAHLIAEFPSVVRDVTFPAPRYAGSHSPR
jgi:predicted nucleic acid-binding protein